MVSLEQIRGEMEKRLETDRALQSVEVNADTVDEALADASVQLDTRTAGLEYEVIERGSAGFLGIGKKPWKLRIYQNPDTVRSKKKAAGDVLFEDAAAEEGEKAQNKDGLAYVHRFGTAICLKVIPPVGDGQPADLREVLDKIRRPDTDKFDEKLIKKLLAEGTDGGYKEIGSYKRVAAGDASISIEISKDEMHATITAMAPAMSGADISADQIMRGLKSQGIVAGFAEDKIQEFVDNPVYNIPYEVASAVLPENGHDSYISYNFETDTAKIRAQETESGQIDFKELNRIQNVVTGQALAVRVAATRGRGGKTLFGHYLEAKNGKEIPVALGRNVKFDADGVTIVAETDGQVMLEGGKITVEPVLTLDAVNIKTGNITFLGTVIIKGSVEDGFDIKAEGDIDIGGTVGISHIESGGNIVVRAGVFGKDEGSIKAGKSLWAKFLQAVKVEAEENVIVSDSIINCDVSVMKNIVLYGKKAQITGGNLFATEEICAKSIGSGGGVETVLSVGIDPRAKKRLDGLQASQGELVKELENIDLDISTLENQKKIRRSLPKDKEETLQNLQNRKDEICTESEAMTKEIEEIQQHLRDLKAVGKVKAESVVYPGTKIYVRDVLDEVRTEVSSVTFYYENAFVKRGKYEPPSVDATKAPDGYSSD